MAKKNRSSSPDEQSTGGFSISKTKVGKQKLVTVTFQLTELQEAHLDSIASANETTRAEFCKQAVNHCLESMNEPFPEQMTEEFAETLEARREKRANWASTRGR